MSTEIAGQHKNDLFRMLLINFLEELTEKQGYHGLLFSMYSATKLFSEISISVSCKSILLFRRSVMIYSRR